MAVFPDEVLQAAEEYFVAQEKPTSGAERDQAWVAE